MKQIPMAEKIAQARCLMKEQNIDAWLTWVRETGTVRDPALDMILGEKNVTWQSAFIIPQEGRGEPVAIVGSYDVASIKSASLYPEIIGHDQGPSEALREVFKKLNLKKVMINYSPDSETADGLTYGMFLLLQKYLEGYDVEFVPSQPVLSILRMVRTSAELALMQKAAKAMLEIFTKVIPRAYCCRPGVSEVWLATCIKNEIRERKFDFAWEEEICPSVFTGPNTAEAHYPPSSRNIERGHLLFIDCGVKIGGYCSDLQRTYYVCERKGEFNPPEKAQKAFVAIHEGITLAAQMMKPGVLGWQVDEACRSHITSLGYPEYKHATGHGIGLSAHDGAAGLFPRWERYGNRPYLSLKENEVYTIEPRISVPGMGIVTVEEMVLVTEEGGKFLSERQKELISICFEAKDYKICED